MCAKCISLEDQITRYLGFARDVDALTKGRICDLVLHLQKQKAAIVHGEDTVQPLALM
jgi:hypothetical protein